MQQTPRSAAGRRDWPLLVVAFVAGLVSLAFEITLARLLAPAFGTSLFVWTNVIGMILVGLSLGAFLGGRIADRWPRPRLLGWICAGTALFILVLPSIAAPLLQLASRALTDRSASIFLASLAACLAVAFPPMLALGTVSPFVVRLRARALDEVGGDAGGVSAIATAGSILGTFLPTLWTIPALGVRLTILALGALLLASSLLLLGLRWIPLLALVGAAWWLPFQLVRGPDTVAVAESQYQFIAVDQSADGTRTLRLNEGQAIHSIYRPGQLRSGTVYDAFGLLTAMHGGALSTMSNIGLAGGTIAHLYQQLYPDVRVTGVEIDPGVIELGRRYFTLDEPNLRVVNQDGRIALATMPDTYDAIAVDAYRQPYIPFHLATREFFELCRSRLNPGGIFAMNVATISRDDAVLTSILNTLAGVYGEVWVWRVPDATNFLVVASDTPGLMERLRAGPVPPELADLQALVLRDAERVRPDPTQLVLTDDRAPVELFTDRMLLDAAQRAGA